MNKFISSRALAPFVAAGLVLGSGGGCLSMQNQATLDGSTGTPYVEAFIAYPGPQDKWAGPAPFVLHVVARESGMAVVTVSSAFRNQTTDTTSTTRAPSSEGGASSAASGGKRVEGSEDHAEKPAHGLTTDAARELLGHLAESVSGPLAPFQGCLSPVRVRLVREDGALVEKLGCRSEKGWARATSEIVSQFITAQVEGTGPGAPPTAPLAAPMADNKEVTEVVKASEKEVMRAAPNHGVAAAHATAKAGAVTHTASEDAAEHAATEVAAEHAASEHGSTTTAAATHAEHEKTGRAPASTESSLAASAEAAVRAAEAAAAAQPSDPEHTLPAPPSSHSGH